MDETECFVTGTLGTALRFSRFAGIAPLRFVKYGNGWRVRVYPRLSYIGYFFITICHFMISWNSIVALINVQNMEASHMHSHAQATPSLAWKITERALWHVQVVMLMTLASTIVYSASKHMSCLISWLNEVQKINSDLNVHNWPTQYNKRQIGSLIVWLMINLVITVNDDVVLITSVGLREADLSLKMSFSLFYVYYWIIQLDIILYVLVLLHVKSSFKAVNESLRNLLQVDSKKTIRHKVVPHVSFAYISACRVVRDINHCYGLKLSMLLISSFSNIVITIYYIITHMVTDLGDIDESFQETYLLGQSVWFLLHVTVLMIIVEPCHLTHVEMTTTQELTSDLSFNTNSFNDPLAVELHQFLKLVTLNEVSYKPLMATTMTRSLVIEILANITTYLIIVIEIK